MPYGGRQRPSESLPPRTSPRLKTSRVTDQPLTSPVVIIPVRDFRGLTRLAGALTEGERSSLARTLCDRVVAAAEGADLEILVVTGSPEVIDWCRPRGIGIVRDPGEGLSAAAATAVSALEGAPWIVLHADLPLVSVKALLEIVETVASDTVLVPSHDGGTNVIASSGPFPFAYGPGSFHRHLAAAPDATVLPSAELSIDIDSPAQLVAFSHPSSSLFTT